MSEQAYNKRAKAKREQAAKGKQAVWRAQIEAELGHALPEGF